MDKNLKNTSALGASGTPILSGQNWVEDNVAILRGYQAAITYEKMRNTDAQIRKILTAIMNPIKSASYNIPPVSEEKKDIEVAALMEQILFKDIQFNKKLHEILTFIPFGFSVFEPIHENKESKEFGQYTGLANLAFRHPSTITEWIHDQNTGKLIKIHQMQTGDIPVDVYIPAEQLLLFINEQEGDNDGFPFLRPMYGAYKRKLLALELEFIGIERFAIPTPLLKVPEKIKISDQEYKDAVAILAGFTSAENSYITYPAGWELILVSNTFDPSKVDAVIKSQNEEMAGAALTTFLELGMGSNGGAYALGKDLSDFFLGGLEAFVKVIIDPINNELIPNLVKLNFGDTIGVYPQLTVSGITDKAGKELMEVITGLTTAGIIERDEILEDHVRKLYNLPKKPEGTMLENQEGEDEKNNIPNSNNELPKESDSDIPPPIVVGLKSSEDNIKLAEAKNVKSLITQQALKIENVMRKNMQFIGEKYVADIMRKYKQLPDSQKIKAAFNITMGGGAIFKKELKAALTNTANLALDMAKKEVPGHDNVKFKDPEGIVKYKNIDYNVNDFKFNDFSKLPKQVQLSIQIQNDLIVAKKMKDISDRVAFQFTALEPRTRDPIVINEQLTSTMEEVVQASKVSVSALDASSSTVNESRHEFFINPEVVKDISSFTFTNNDPKTQICTELNGSTYYANSAELLQYQPPLHFGCKSYIVANLANKKNQPEVTGAPALSKTAQGQIQFNDGDNNGK